MSVKVIKLSIEKSEFYLHWYRGNSPITMIFIPGLMESKSGFYYLGQEIALYYQKLNISVILFDLAGQGDSNCEFSFDIWKKQLEAICSYCKNQRIIFIGRGLGACLPFLIDNQTCNNFEVIALTPPNLDRLHSILDIFKLYPSPITKGRITPKSHNKLSLEEKNIWHSLGAEVECLGSMELPKNFIKHLNKLISTLKNKIHYNRIYDALDNNFPKTLKLKNPAINPLFNKKIEREALLDDIKKYIL